MDEFTNFKINVNPDTGAIDITKVNDIEPTISNIPTIRKIYESDTSCRYNPFFHKKLGEFLEITEYTIKVLESHRDTYHKLLSDSRLNPYDRIACHLMKITNPQEIEQLNKRYYKYNSNCDTNSDLKETITRAIEIRHKTIEYLKAKGFPLKKETESYDLWCTIPQKDLERRNLIKKDQKSKDKETSDNILKDIQRLEADIENLQARTKVIESSQEYKDEINAVMYFIGINKLSAESALAEAKKIYLAVADHIDVQEWILDFMINGEDIAIKNILNDNINETKQEIKSELSKDTKISSLKLRMNVLEQKTAISKNELGVLYDLCKNRNGEFDIGTLRDMKDNKINISDKYNKSRKTKESRILENAGIRELEYIYAWICIKKDIEQRDLCINNSKEFIDNGNFSQLPPNICSCIRPRIEYILEQKRLFETHDSYKNPLIIPLMSKDIEKIEKEINEENMIIEAKDDGNRLVNIVETLSNISRELGLK